MAQRIHPVEFVAIMAMMMASVAFSIDSMLPALPDMARDLQLEDANDIQLVLSMFMIGMGLGTFFTGPLSDSFGRKTIILLGVAIYLLGTVLAWRAPTLDLLVAARMLQGLGAAAPRIIAIAIIRDLHSGRDMARLVSFVMMVFTIFPAIAPLVGAWIVGFSSWHGIFIAFMIFVLIGSSWFTLRIEEPLPKERRRPFRVISIVHAAREMLGIQMVRLTLVVQVLIMSTMFITISLIEPAFTQVFDRSTQFPYWFFALGMLAGTSSLVNATLVGRYGMRKIITFVLSCFLVLSAAMLLFHLFGPRGLPYFVAYLVWQAAVYYQIGMTMGNLNALAMEPVGHIAGLAASVIGAVSTISSAILSTLVAQTFNGTILPQLLSSFVLSGLALLVMLRVNHLERHKDQ
ncbi:multidrug effflux MFS transporter [Pseudooceanicola sp. CBS1P-1]|uniref:MFS transporter n=1 Tax=Pseudooceanicola albus TaxID=2692189 RepID=A0A6L7FXM2_9RHOB|nr:MULTISPECIES: multidrug effflux MFS transporter [Pseudooceanicola]MBT9383238.1 multidrug effflux MFS transporter [Pseudooceanicola endophyticus]MXN16439.1 MFS transporter [Pseudooceanicola albus]